jgi:hypothetical protein
MSVRSARQKIVGSEEFDGDAVEELTMPAPDERMLAFEDVTRAAEALQGLKPQEIRALWLRMEGRTYKEIAADLGWTYTKVNRCVTEGRRAFIARYAGIESGAECRRLESSLSALVDGELTGDDARLLRRHLKGCGGCRATLRAMRSGQRSLGAVLPVALVVGGHDGGESALGLFVRVYEAVAGSVQERAVTLAAKAQIAVEAGGAAKVAAVAGAAAAVAGGGAVTAQKAATPPPRAEAAQVRQHRPSVSVSAPKAVVPPPSSVTTAARPARPARPAPIVIRRTERSHERETPRTSTEFAFEQSRPVQQVAEPQPRPTQTDRRPQRAGGEFDLEP